MPVTPVVFWAVTAVMARRAVHAKRGKCLQVGLDTRACARVAAGDGQDGANSREVMSELSEAQRDVSWPKTSRNWKGGTASRLSSRRPASPADRVTVSGAMRSCGPGPPPPGSKSTTPRQPCGFSDRRTFFRSMTICDRIARIVHFAIRVDDEHGVERRGRQLGIGRRAMDRPDDIRQVFALGAPPDGLEHDGLNVLGVDHAVLFDSPRELHREPPACGSKLRDRGTFGDLQRIHDLMRLLPLVAIGSVEQAQILGAEQAAIARVGRGGSEAGSASLAARRRDVPA